MSVWPACANPLRRIEACSLMITNISLRQTRHLSSARNSQSRDLVNVNQPDKHGVKQGPKGRTFTVGNHFGTTQGPPLINDPQPFHGSQFDITETNRQPADPRESYKDEYIASNLTFATLPLTLQGSGAKAAMSQDLDPGFDLPGIQRDIAFLSSQKTKAVAWRWYQEGYDHEPADADGAASHDSYVSHHEGPQYFGYIANNPALRGNLRGLGDFFTDLAAAALPPVGGVFYIRGGFSNIAKQVPYVHPGTPGAKAGAIIAGKLGVIAHVPAIGIAGIWRRGAGLTAESRADSSCE
jgi:phospholipase C